MSLFSVIRNSVWAHSRLHDITMPSRGKRGEPGVFLHPTFCSDLTLNPLHSRSRWILRRHPIFDIWYGSGRLLLLSACWKNMPQKHLFTSALGTNFVLFTHFFWDDVFSKLPNNYKYGQSNLSPAPCWPLFSFGSVMPTSPWWWSDSIRSVCNSAAVISSLWGHILTGEETY